MPLRALHSQGLTPSQTTVKSLNSHLFLRLLYFPWLSGSSIPTNPPSQTSTTALTPTSEKLSTVVPCGPSLVAPVSCMPFPRRGHAVPHGPRGPHPPREGGISGVARDVATCAAEAVCVSVGGVSFERDEGGARRAVTSPLSHSHRLLP